MSLTQSISQKADGKSMSHLTAMRHVAVALALTLAGCALGAATFAVTAAWLRSREVREILDRLGAPIPGEVAIDLAKRFDAATAAIEAARAALKP